MFPAKRVGFACLSSWIHFGYDSQLFIFKSTAARQLKLRRKQALYAGHSTLKMGDEHITSMIVIPFEATKSMSVDRYCVQKFKDIALHMVKHIEQSATMPTPAAQLPRSGKYISSLLSNPAPASLYLKTSPALHQLTLYADADAARKHCTFQIVLPMSCQCTPSSNLRQNGETLKDFAKRYLQLARLHVG